jgi:hypothetical protein
MNKHDGQRNTTRNLIAEDDYKKKNAMHNYTHAASVAFSRWADG